MTQWLPSMTAVVFTDCRSDTGARLGHGDGRHQLAGAGLGIHFFFCSSVP